MTEDAAVNVAAARCFTRKMRSCLADHPSVFVLFSRENVLDMDPQLKHCVNKKYEEKKKQCGTGFNDVIKRPTFLEASGESRFDA